MKKILIISHLPIGPETNVGKTLYNIFSGYSSPKLCQLFFKDVGNKRDIDSFYISDNDIVYNLKHIHNKNCGKIYQFTEQCLPCESTTKVSHINLRSPFALLARDIFWHLSPFFKKGLFQWINKMKPEAVFLAPGYSSFAYLLAKKIARVFSIPLYLFIMEDFYNEKRFSISPLFWIRYFLFRFAVRSCLKDAKCVFTLNEGLKELYISTFHKKTITLFNPADNIVQESNNQEKRHIRTILYAGSIGLSRINELELFGKSISKFGGQFVFKVFGPAQNPELLDRIKKCPGVYYGGCISSEVLKKEIEASDAVLHLESFRKKYIAKTKLAFSTKIPEYLGSGNLVIAYGPPQIESMRYLRENGAAVTICEKNGIDNFLNNASSGSIDVDSIIKKALYIANKNHNKENIQHKLYNELNN